MSTRDLARTAYTVECFLNATQWDDGPERTRIEEALVRWLNDRAGSRNDHLIYQDGRIDCYRQAQVVRHFDVPAARQTQTLWCDGRKLSIVDTDAFAQGARLVLLGTAGLQLQVSGRNWSAGIGLSSNNNNNNNNG